MKKTIQFRVFYDDDGWFVADCMDLPIVTQAKTLDALAHNIAEAIELFFEDEDPAELGCIPNPSIIFSVELPSLLHAKTKDSVR